MDVSCQELLISVHSIGKCSLTNENNISVSNTHPNQSINMNCIIVLRFSLVT